MVLYAVIAFEGYLWKVVEDNNSNRLLKCFTYSEIYSCIKFHYFFMSIHFKLKNYLVINPSPIRKYMRKQEISCSTYCCLDIVSKFCCVLLSKFEELIDKLTNLSDWQIPVSMYVFCNDHHINPSYNTGLLLYPLMFLRGIERDQ